jgi:hypothetical protein
MANDIESGNHTYKDYVAISPDGSMVAKISPRNGNVKLLNIFRLSTTVY